MVGSLLKVRTSYRREKTVSEIMNGRKVLYRLEDTHGLGDQSPLARNFKTLDPQEQHNEDCRRRAIVSRLTSTESKQRKAWGSPSPANTGMLKRP
ncbi:unnamed protein product, partial [Discosporangium mesarthrocarpum]